MHKSYAQQKPIENDLTVFVVCLTKYDCKDTKNNRYMQMF